MKIIQKMQKKNPIFLKLSKIVKKSESLKHYKIFFPFSFLQFFFPLKNKKYYPLSFPILGGCNFTRALQSSPFQNPGGGSPEPDGAGRTKEILVSNIGCFWFGLQQQRSQLRLRKSMVSQCKQSTNIARIAKRCPENISSIFKVSKCSY